MSGFLNTFNFHRGGHILSLAPKEIRFPLEPSQFEAESRKKVLFPVEHSFPPGNFTEYTGVYRELHILRVNLPIQEKFRRRGVIKEKVLGSRWAFPPLGWDFPRGKTLWRLENFGLRRLKTFSLGAIGGRKLLLGFFPHPHDVCFFKLRGVFTRELFWRNEHSMCSLKDFFVPKGRVSPLAA